MLCKIQHKTVFCCKQTRVKTLPIINHSIYRPNSSPIEMTNFRVDYLEPIHNTINISTVASDHIPVYEDIN